MTVQVNTPKLKLRRLAEGDVTNDAVMRHVQNEWDLVANLSLVSVTTTAQPSPLNIGDCYFVPPGATGATWLGEDNKLCLVLPTGPVYIPIFDGARGYIQDQGVFAVYFDGAWRRPGIQRKAVMNIETVAASNLIRIPMFHTQSACTIQDFRARSGRDVTAGLTVTLAYSLQNESTATNIVTTLDADLVGTIITPSVPADRHVWLSVNSSSSTLGVAFQITYTEEI
tara:strand:+ start:1643 stop:2320 length:678 start_codon:yes stop_codon:yes gene_type:complete